MHFYSYFGAKVPLFPDMTKKKSINLHKRGKKSALRVPYTDIPVRITSR